MTTFIRIFFFLCLSSYACLTMADTPAARPVSYVVLLDLSDRLLGPDQGKRDISLVQAVYERFEQRVRAQFIINSRDRFRVVVAPQRGIQYQPEPYLDALYLDMGTTPMATKRQRIDALRAELPRQLTALYADALAGRRKPRDFAGCDIWQYVNDQLPTDLDAAYDNKLIILTDGYLDFENNPRALRDGKRATDSRMLDRLRHDQNWRQSLAKPTEGLIPVKKPLPNLTVCVAEVHPKFDNLNETDLLIELWNKWLHEMHIRRWVVQTQGSRSKSMALLKQFLQTH